MLLSRMTCVLLAVCMCGAVMAELRLWTGRDGSILVAEMISVKNGKVTLRRQDGETVTVPISRFSDEDVKYIENAGHEEKEESRALPFKPVVHLTFDNADQLGLNATGGKPFRARQLAGEPAGRKHGAAVFNGRNSFVILNKPMPLQNQPFTVAVWFKTDFAEHQEIFSYGGGAKGCCLYTDGSKVGMAYRWGQRANYKEFSSSKIDAASGEWKHVCITVDQDGNATLYGNGGKLISRSVEMVSEKVQFGAKIGQSVGDSVSGEEGVKPFDGMLDEFLWFDVALNADEVQQLYASYP